MGLCMRTGLPQQTTLLRWATCPNRHPNWGAQHEPFDTRDHGGLYQGQVPHYLTVTRLTLSPRLAASRERSEDDGAGPELRGAERPEWVTNKQWRLAKTQVAMAALGTQAAIDADGQVLAAEGSANAADDRQHVAPMVEEIEKQTGRLPCYPEGTRTPTKGRFPLPTWQVPIMDVPGG